MPIHIHAYQYRQVPTNMYNTYHMYNTYKYMSISINTNQYIPYMLIHMNRYNTRWYTYAPSNTDQYLSICTLYNIMWHHVYNTYKCIQIPTNIDHYIQYIQINTNIRNTCQYISIHMNTDECLSFCKIHTICTIHTNTYKYMLIPAHIKCQYIQIHTNTCNTYQKQYIPQYIPCRGANSTQYIPKNSTIQTTIYSKTYHEFQYSTSRTLPCPLRTGSTVSRTAAWARPTSTRTSTRCPCWSCDSCRAPAPRGGCTARPWPAPARSTAPPGQVVQCSQQHAPGPPPHRPRHTPRVRRKLRAQHRQHDRQRRQPHVLYRRVTHPCQAGRAFITKAFQVQCAHRLGWWNVAAQWKSPCKVQLTNCVPLHWPSPSSPSRFERFVEAPGDPSLSRPERPVWAGDPSLSRPERPVWAGVASFSRPKRPLPPTGEPSPNDNQGTPDFAKPVGRVQEGV